MAAPYSTREEIDEAHSALTATFATGRSKDLAWRKWQLKQLWWLLEDNEERILEVLRKDLDRHTFESCMTDLLVLKEEILDFLKNLDKWTAEVKIDAGLIFGYLSKSHYRKEPLGVSLIIGAWNFPILMALLPVVPAIASGCCILIKPSELAIHSEALLRELIPKYFDPTAIRILTGGVSETTYILEKRWNQIFFTGSSKVGQFVAEAAAKHLTPTVLELGGLGPAVVTKTADIDLAARRIAYSKFINAGQICVAVNHVIAEPEIVDKLVERLSYWNDQFMKEGDNPMCKIINARNFDRLVGLLEQTNGKIVYGGKLDKEATFIHPTIVRDVTLEDSLMSEELFGPILPIITATFEDAIQCINSLSNPLASYIFSKDDSVVQDFLNRTLSGGVTVNNVVIHSSIRGAPFGGVGGSGYGYYHGVTGIDCFTHKRTVATPPSWLDGLMAFTYPPYQLSKVSYLKPKNSLGFKRGETLEDQRKGSSGAGTWALSAIGVAVVAGLYLNRSQGRGLEAITNLFKP
ncbi:unnamed protein product [Clonostachys solani]|uniref:Aldehyde dehydrogenase n=1 Tax=Clonostachys solani TaxID=160281 RepID=A0A9N9W8A8_9HYPO|nr:unnamed protein product [Clonostachys solani]